ncbi:Cys-tRNA(Pro) deacylase [Bacillus sp. FJAT-45350]|uniref:Cys-tRNA(Pro) deacylase n=1 Tax=Bacillus sp. FJAT-45350 TaxID=2011014 RepID=UPI000BB81F9D|nr:Cys-tRNA(Pro) deacylase [Bacillus sp. FJAT-45350]
MSKVKTNAMRMLDSKKIDYHILTYSHDDGLIDGVSVAKKVERDPSIVYKTLVAKGSSNSINVYVIPVEAELNLKKAAKSSGEKKVEMVPVKDILALTGYIRGGCSPIGMKKLYPTYIDNAANELSNIIVSGGKIGLQIELSVQSLQDITNAEIADIT